MQSTFLRPSSPNHRAPLVDRELTLYEMLADTIVIRLMKRDGVTRAEVVQLFTAPARKRLCRAA